MIMNKLKALVSEDTSRDVAQHKRAEQALRESEEKYRSILDNIEDGYYEVDIAGTFTFFNDAMCKILRYSRDELMGMNNREYSDEENSRKVYETFNRVHRTGEPARGFDWQIIRKDGGVRLVEASVSLIKNPSGRPTGFRGIVHDITERKRAEEELKESQQWLAAVYDSSRDGIIVEESERIVYVNQSYAHLFGYEIDELIGKPAWLVSEQEPSERMLEYSRRRVRGEEAPSLYEFRGTRKDGTTVDLEASVSTAKIGGKTYIIAAARDITERKRAQEEIAQLAEIVASSHDGMVGTSGDGIIVNWNKGAERIYGYSAEEIVGSPLSLLIPDDCKDEFPATFERLKKGDSIDNLETKRLRKDGTLIDVSLTLSPVTDSSGELTAISAIIRDITERKRAESEILLQKARFQQLFENAPLGILRVDQNDIVLDANKEFEDIFQFSLDEMRGRPINEIVVPKAHREEGTTLSSKSLQGETIDQESVRQRKDGTPIPVHIYGVPIVVNQKPVGVFAIYVDLSERKRLEQERQAVFEIIQGAISTSDLSDLFKLVHKSISSLLYAENCFIALHDPNTDLMHFDFWVDKLDPCPPPLPLDIGFGSYVLRTGQSLLLDRELTERMYRSGEVKKSGSSSASWLGVPLRTHSRTIGVLVVQHYESEHIYTQSDLEFLTSVGSQIALAIERKQAERALLEANKRALTEYERLIERIASLGQTLGSARDLTMIFRALRDFAGASVPCDGLLVSLYEREKQSRRVAYCWTDNEELNLKNVIEVPVGEGITGKAISSGTVIIDNNFKPLLGARGKPVLLGERADDSIPRSALIVPMTVMGRTVGCVEVQAHHINAYVQEHATAMRMAANLAANAVENVTLIASEQAKEEQLRQAQKMESIGTLAGGIAHDFNNLMTAVTGYSDLALRSFQGDDSLRSKIEEIKKAGERAAALTRQLLAFSRKQMLQPRVLDLNTVVTGMAQMLPRLIGEHIDLRFRLGNSLGQVKADPGQVEQVIMNLAVNARDAMPEGGVLTIKTANVHLTGKFGRCDLSVEPGQYVMMDVSDTGSGMDSETQSHIFEPFFTTKGVGKGTGLGLSTVYGIVKQSGGSLSVYSEVEKGTAFKIYLPRVDVLDESAEIVCETEEAPRGHEMVLLVEDEDVVRNLSKEILETYGYSVLVASNGREGLGVGKEFQGKIDLVITDVIMPLMSGREMAEGLRTIRPDTRVLFMSGFTDDAIVHHGVLDETVFFIQKPFSPEALATKAREVLDYAGV
jgi:PAS domain S-box-containing protein